MGAWRTAKSVLTLLDQLRPLAVGAPPGSFGTIGDLSHAASTSDHNPRLIVGLGSTPVVTAGDFPWFGRLDPHAVLEAIRRSRDPRVKYAISRGQMFSSYPTSSHSAWTWRPYSGRDQHITHGHLSVVADARADDPRPWQITIPTTMEDPVSLTPLQATQLENIERYLQSLHGMTEAAVGISDTVNRFSVPNKAVAALAAAAAPMSVQVDASQVAAALAADQTFLAALGAAVADELHRRTAD